MLSKRIVTSIDRYPPLHTTSLCQAGTGKTQVAKMLMRLRRCSFAALTGKAASNENGRTLHSIFVLRTNQTKAEIESRRNGHVSKVSDRVVAHIRSVLAGVEYLLIDEWTMIGALMMADIELRLRCAFDDDQLFGGLNVVSRMRKVQSVHSLLRVIFKI